MFQAVLDEVDLGTYWSLYVLTLCIARWYVRNIKINEHQPHLVELPDPVYDYLPEPVDTSLPIAVILWGCTADFLWHWFDWSSAQFCVAYSLFMIVRSLILVCHPFRGCAKMIPLRDPIIELVVQSKEILKQDLSVGGHCSLLFLFGLFVPAHRWMFWIATVLTGALLVLSRVHYLADCILGPMVVYCMHALSVPLSDFWQTHHSHGAALVLAAFFLAHRARLPALCAPRWMC